ncbi:hypothetical protein DRW03_32820 [Corallococcus sp. H22C18031201]|uniref:YopT-type cysteine protease domain-containing protein n=1 Tax=Citreicoccus inhibens TaxID=2849499 RepID=UPI000E73B0FD|nr:YopT-type cysteine protease domain-containing protein [Citreicoccus inhibens]MBU8898325.1 hypothetical protein [Citreicoccus inhibens]RJS15608.1 hypothetical protein DRW03_32820 [Corallococcus sp. H22C18031201]
MRKAQCPFNQTQVAFFEKQASIIEKYKFRGICFILSLQWLELRSAGNTNAGSISKLLHGGKFRELWVDFETQTQMASRLQKELRTEVDQARIAAESFVPAISGLQGMINQLTTDETDLHIQLLARLQELRAQRREQVLRERGAKGQLQRMFASEDEQLHGDTGTFSEQIMRKVFAMTLKLVVVDDLKVEKKRTLFADTLNWSHAGTIASQLVMLTGDAPAMFEIGFYGDGAHSIALYTEGKGTYSLFDPNYGVFEGNGNLNTLSQDLSKLMEDKYPKMNKFVISWLTAD